MKYSLFVSACGLGLCISYPHTSFPSSLFSNTQRGNQLNPFLPLGVLLIVIVELVIILLGL